MNGADDGTIEREREAAAAAFSSSVEGVDNTGTGGVGLTFYLYPLFFFSLFAFPSSLRYYPILYNLTRPDRLPPLSARIICK